MLTKRIASTIIFLIIKVAVQVADLNEIFFGRRMNLQAGVSDTTMFNAYFKVCSKKRQIYFLFYFLFPTNLFFKIITKW